MRQRSYARTADATGTRLELPPCERRACAPDGAPWFPDWMRRRSCVRTAHGGDVSRGEGQDALDRGPELVLGLGRDPALVGRHVVEVPGVPLCCHPDLARGAVAVDDV